MNSPQPTSPSLAKSASGHSIASPNVPRPIQPNSLAACVPQPDERSTVLPTPAELKTRFSLGASTRTDVARARRRLQDRIEQARGAPIAIVGPCSIHSEGEALHYAERLKLVQERIGDRIQLVMRAYFEKPRTTVGWKGFLYDPNLDGSDDLSLGLERTRALLVRLAEMNLPLATEILDPLLAPFIDDCLSWVAIGARTSESQIHRQMASALPCPVGFKNGTDGSVENAAHAIASAATRHTRLGIDDAGRAALLESRGNAACHLVLRGGTAGPNYSVDEVRRAAQTLVELGRAPCILIDCSHGNSEKDHNRQPQVARAVMKQLGQDHADVLGLMLESHLESGRQGIAAPRRYGVSITDSCIDFSTTERLMLEFAEHVNV